MAMRRRIRFLNYSIPKNRKKAVIKKTEGQTICFENISFSYTPGKQVLKEVSFSTKERGITALVGTSGCGKSTITSLLMKENRPQSGVITLGGEVLSDFTTEGLMKKDYKNYARQLYF